jgi:hypothetical protein
MLHIYCDGNNGIDAERFDLGCPGSMADITKAIDVLRDGQRVLFYETNDWEAEGTIHFDQESKRWFGVPDFSTLRHFDRPAPDEKRA